MRVTRVHTFHRPIDDCWAMFHDPASHVAKFEAMGHRDLQVLEQDVDDDSIRLVLERVVDVDVPSFAKRVISPSNTLRSEDHWTRAADGTCSGTFSLETKGVPIDISGTTLLTPADDDPGATSYEITIEMKVKVPVIGGKISQVAKGIVERQVDDEFRLGDEWLAAH
jgi:hypothetical protein